MKGKKRSFNFGNFAIARPVCTTCYHKGLQPTTHRMQNNKTKKQKTSIKLNFKKIIKKLNNLFSPPLTPNHIKRSVKLKIKFLSPKDPFLLTVH